jgi:predicted transcriptional regulator
VNTAQVQVTVNALPTVIAGANQTVCAGTSVTLSGSGATSYVWNNGITNAIAFTPVATQNYTVTGTNANGCVNTAQATITVNALPTVSAGANQTVCAGTSVTLSGTGATSYAWNNGVTNATAFTPVATQNYTVTGTDANGCVNTAQVQVTINALPTVSAGANQTVCAGTSVTLSGSGATSYAWNNGVTNATAFTPVATQNYTVTGTNANGCVNTAQVQVTVNALPTVSAGANQTVCAGTSVTLSGTGATSYAWNNGVTNATAFTPVATQNYTVTGTDANGCVNTAQVQVTINALPTVSAGANQTVCAGTSVTLSGTGATSYAWNNGVTNATAFTPVATQNYTVTGTNANGCVNTAQVQVTINALPTVSAGANQTVCAGTSVTLSGTGATSYAWNNGVTNATAFTPVATQNYTVTGIDSNLCSNSDTMSLTVNQGSSSFLNQTACDFYTLNGQNYTQSGAYLQTLTNTLGCDSTINLNLTLNYSPTTPMVSVTNDVDLSTTVQANANYQWIICSDNTNIPGATTSNYTAASNGLYGVIVSNTCGADTSNCINIDNIGLNENLKESILIYPNPSFSYIKIMGLNTEGSDFEVRDGQGRILKIGNVSSTNSIIDLGSFEAGIYWVNLNGIGVYELIKE